MLTACPDICVVDGGFHNIEFTAANVNKGLGLHFLAKELGISMEETMAVGDSGMMRKCLRLQGLVLLWEMHQRQSKIFQML